MSNPGRHADLNVDGTIDGRHIRVRHRHQDLDRRAVERDDRILVTPLAAGRRRAIAELVAEARVPLVEDHALAGLAWEEPPPPIAAHRPQAPIAVIGSLSKTYWGGLRIGFVRAPAPVALRFARVKATHDLGTSAVSQVLAERLLAGGPPARLVRHHRPSLRRRGAGATMASRSA